MGLRDLVFGIRADDMTGQAFAKVKAGLKAIDGTARMTRDRLNSLSASMSRLGSLQNIAGTLPITLGLRGAITTSIDFEAAMNRVKAVLRPTGREMEALAAESRRLGKETSFSAIEAADGVEILARNGLSASQILGGALSASLSLAAAGGSELAAAGDLVTDILGQFRMGAEDAAAAADLVAGGMNASKFGFDDFRLAVGQAGGVASGAGVSFRDLVSALSATSSQFASGSDAGTSYKTFVVSLTGKSAEARAAIQSLGLEFFDASGKIKSTAAVAGELDRAFSGMSEAQRLATMNVIFGTDAMRTAIGLMQAGRDGIEGVNAALADASASDMAAARMDGATGAVSRLRAAMTELGLAVGSSGVLDAFTRIATGLSDMVNWLSTTDPVVQRVAVSVGMLVAILPPLALGIAGVSTALAALSGPIGLVVGGLALLAAGAISLAGSSGQATSAIGSEAQATQELSGVLATGIALSRETASAKIVEARNRLANAEAALREARAMAAARAETASHLSGKSRAMMLNAGGGDRQAEQRVDDLSTQIATETDNLAKLEEAVSRPIEIPPIIGSLGDIATGFDGVGAAAGSAGSAAAAGASSAGEAARAAALAAKAAAEAAKQAAEEAAADEAWRSMGESMADFVLNVDSVGDAVESLRQRVLKAALGAVFEQAFSALKSPLTSAASSGGLGGGFMSSIGGLLGFPGFANGGAFEVGGRSGRDRNLVTMALSRGENVEVTRRGQSSGQGVTVNIMAQDPAAFRSSRTQIGAQITRAVAAGRRGS